MRKFLSRVGPFVLMTGSLCLCAQTQTPVLTTIGAVRALSAQDAAKKLPVDLRGVITYNNQRELNVFVQDDTGYIYVEPSKAAPYPPGTLVEVKGNTSSSYTSQIEATSIRALGQRALPSPVSVDYETATLQKNDCRYVSMKGIVRAASLQTTYDAQAYLLQLQVDRNMVDVAIMAYPNFDPKQLIDATVRVNGVLGGTFDSRDQIVGLALNVTSSRDVEILQPSSVASHAQLTPLASLLRSDDSLRPTHRVFAKGVVILYDPGESLLIQDGDSHLLVRTRQMNPVPIGQRVEVTGFLTAVNGSPALNLGQFWPVHGMEPLAAKAISFADGMSGKYSNALVSLDGQVISQTRESHVDTIFLRSGHRVFQAVFRKMAQDPDRIPSLAPGTTVRVTGVCMVHVRGFWGAVESFQIHLRDPGDVVVLESASWWTVSHLFTLVSWLLGVSLAASIWALWMRRRVSVQEKLLRHKIESEAAQLARQARLEHERSYILELINSFQPLPLVLTAIQAYADELWPGTHGYSHVLRDRKLVLMGRSHLPKAALARLELIDPASSPEPCARAVRTRGPVTVNEPHSVWSRPILSRREEILGTVTFEANSAGALPLNSEAFEFGCNLAAIAIDNRRLYEEAVHRSEHDPLTGLPNRSLLFRRMEEALERARESHGFAAVVYLDLDEFKSVNDLYSHRVGDLYLIEVAQRFKTCLRACDTLSRVGGDEFIVVLADLSDPDQAHSITHRLLESMQAPIVIEGNTTQGTVSVGMAVYPACGSNSDEITHAADGAMYVAKRAGGNQVSVAGGVAAAGYGPLADSSSLHVTSH